MGNPAAGSRPRARSAAQREKCGWAPAVPGPGWAVLTGRGDLDFLPPGQCLLLRPDHIVAWRGSSPEAAEDVRAALLRGRPVPV